MNKRQQIIDTTIKLISEMGLYGTSMALIIKESNVAAGTIYHYFKSKDDLIHTIYSELKEEMGTAFIQNMDSSLTYKENFFIIWHNLFYFFYDNPKKFEFLQHFSNSPLVKNVVKELNQRHYQPAIDFIQKGIDLGVLRDLPVHFIINLIFSQVSVITRMIFLEAIIFSDSLLQKAIQSSWDSVRIN
jgi:TetR/AcrR family transcriptional regulator, multidrug resistance operon repressor